MPWSLLGPSLRQSRVFSLATAGFLAAAIACSQDLLILANGEQVEGRVESDRAGRLVYLVPSGKLVLPRADIARLDTTRPFDRYVSYSKGLIRHKDYAQAETVLVEGMKKFMDNPVRRKVLGAVFYQLGTALSEKKQYGDARRILATLLKYETGVPGARDALERMERICRRTEREITGLRQALQEDPGNDYARFQLGLRYEAIGARKDARREYEAILKQYPQVSLARFKGSLDLMRSFIQAHMVIEKARSPGNARKYATALAGGWKKSESTRVTIYHHNYDLAEAIARTVESILPGLEKEFGIQPSSTRYVIWVYRNRDEFERAWKRKGVYGFCSGPMEIQLFQTAPRLLQSVLPHEMVHATLYRKYKGLPSWIDEGLAVSREWGRELYYLKVRRWLAAGKTLSLENLLEADIAAMKGEQREVFYGQAYTLVDYLVRERGGKTAFWKFVRAIASSGNVREAFTSVYQVNSLASLEKDWRSYLEH